MATGNESTASLLARALLLQAVVLVAIAVVLRWRLPSALAPVVASGLVAIMATLASGVLVLRRCHGASAVVAAFLVAEIVKFLVVIAGFALVFRIFSEQLQVLNPLLLIGAFALTLAAQWLAPMMARNQRSLPQR